MPRTLEGKLDATGARFAIVVSRFNSLVTQELLAGALDTLRRLNADTDKIDVAWVPGSFELPVAVKAFAESGSYDAVIALGCIMKGQTTHDQHIAGEAAKGLGQVALATGVPIGFGVLTPDTLEQALDRAGMKAGNKGAEAALAAAEMVSLFRTLGKKSRKA